MSALQDWLDFKRNTHFPVTPDGFRAAVVRLISAAFEEAEAESSHYIPAEPIVVFMDEFRVAGTVSGWDPIAFGYQKFSDLPRESAPKGRVH